MRIAIVDDEVHCIESLTLHLNNLFPDMDIVYKSNDPKDALFEIPKIKPDLIFLDVEMPGMNGFELLEQLSDHQFDIIFTTAYSKYAVKAFKAKAVDYLLKPIDRKLLKMKMDCREEHEYSLPLVMYLIFRILIIKTMK